MLHVGRSQEAAGGFRLPRDHFGGAVPGTLFLIKSLTSEERGYTFLVELLRQVTRLMSELKEEEVEIDDVRPSNLVVEGPKDRYVFRLFYDERQKNKFLDMRGLYISQERIEEW